MKNNTTFDFAVDKATHSIRVKRELATSLSTAWDVLTKPKLLNQWTKRNIINPEKIKR